MTLTIAQPQYGGTFSTLPESAPRRFVLPGEVLDGSNILTESPTRTTPKCPHFGICGGCDYQHATYPTQLALKQTILTQILPATPPIQTHTADPWSYRNRIRLRIERHEGTFRFGYNLRATHDFLPIVTCPIAAPTLLRAAAALLATDSPWLPSIAEVEFHTNGTVVQATFFTRKPPPNPFATLCKGLQTNLPELIGAGALPANAGYGAKEHAQWGAPGLTHTVSGRNLWVTRGAFFQVNTPLLPTMLSLVTQHRTGILAWDLYAGVGLFSRALAETFTHVVAVESSATAAKDLATSNKARNLTPIPTSVAAFLERAVLERERPTLIVMDPPRAGLGPEVCALLARVAAPELVYVSCDPTTLARDLALLIHSGYRIEQVHLLDMFPQTFHLETVVFLKK